MKPRFEVDDYYELLILYKAVIQAKFHPEPIDEIISGSPVIESCVNRMVEVLAQMEIEGGRPDIAAQWKGEINPDGELWNIAQSRLRNTSKWDEWSYEQKKTMARILISPFLANEALLDRFVKEGDKLRSEL